MPLDPLRKSCQSPRHESLPPLSEVNYSEAKPVRLLRYANLRLETAAVLLGYLPIQGEAEAKQNKRATPTESNTHDMKPRPPRKAEKALHEATEAVIES